MGAIALPTIMNPDNEDQFQFEIDDLITAKQRYEQAYREGQPIVQSAPRQSGKVPHASNVKYMNPGGLFVNPNPIQPFGIINPKDYPEGLVRIDESAKRVLICSPVSVKTAVLDQLSGLAYPMWVDAEAILPAVLAGFNKPKITREQTMLERIIKLYYAYMAQDVRSPIPHLAGPPGVGKSTVVQQLADMLGVTLHTINVSRLSPLEIEGIMMPIGSPDIPEDYRLKLLVSTIWSKLKEGDIVLLDEFLRGFPEVYNALLDIMTSREVAGYKLPKVFFIAASNSVASYDKALEDRLLHLPVADLRTNKTARKQAESLLVDALGLNPAILGSTELSDLITQEVLPMYDVLDQFKGKGNTAGAASTKGSSLRKLIGQAQLREIESVPLNVAIEFNNTVSIAQNKVQFVFLVSGKNPPPNYEDKARKLVGNDKLTEIQRVNLTLNLQLIEMEAASTESLQEEGEVEDDDIFAP